MTLKKKLTKWKRRLLDVGKRNRLINFRKSIASTVEIIADDFYKLYDDFMDSNSYEFAKLFDTVGDFDGAFEESLDQKLTNALGKTIYYKDRYEISEINEIRKRFKPNPKKNYLYSTTIYQRLNYVLNNLSKKGRLYYEENGVNALYMAFGFLSYIEDGQEFLAPLALVPIEISQRSVADPFKVRPLDDDFIINDNIVHKFKLDYKIDLGRLDGEELKKYLTSVNAKVAKLNFKVINSVYIGLFSFSKIMMYQDILNNEDKITKSPVVRALVGLDTTLNQNIKLDEVNLDKAEGLEEQNQVLAADSSQYKAIYYAKEGLSFVLQGPPGTGKSQTITNMLAELIAKNKKVLFVCEKKSALEVVYRNLKKCSLDMYALPLFDTKANKKDIVKGIYDNLNSVQNNRIKVSDKARDDMATDENLMMKMNQYLEEILTKIEPINMSIYDLVSKPNINFEELDSLSIKDLKNIKDILSTDSVTGAHNNVYRDHYILPNLEEEGDPFKVILAKSLGIKILNSVSSHSSTDLKIKSTFENLIKNLNEIIPEGCNIRTFPIHSGGGTFEIIVKNDYKDILNADKINQIFNKMNLNPDNIRLFGSVKNCQNPLDYDRIYSDLNCICEMEKSKIKNSTYYFLSPNALKLLDVSLASAVKYFKTQSKHLGIYNEKSKLDFSKKIVNSLIDNFNQLNIDNEKNGKINIDDNEYVK